MGTEIGMFAVRRSIWIDADPARVWHEFASFERMVEWYGTGHTLLKYEPFVGGLVEVEAGEYRFAGRVLVFEPARELTIEQEWAGKGWQAAPRVTLRLTAVQGGTLVELFHHGFERTGEDPGEALIGFENGWTLRQLEALRAVV
jgi:uncharacterized protein YndB with AHSA1/START domain